MNRSRVRLIPSCALALRYNKSFSATPITLVPTPEERRDRSVWVVDHINLYGSVFSLKGAGLVTAAHCVKGLSEVEILHPSKHTTTFSAKVLKRHDHRDLALIDTSTIPATDYFEPDVATTPPLVGDPVTAVGYSHWAPGDRLNHRPGFVSLITPQAGVRKIEVSQMTQGMSGGPILDANAGVVGIIHRRGAPTSHRSERAPRVAQVMRSVDAFRASAITSDLGAALRPA